MHTREQVHLQPLEVRHSPIPVCMNAHTHTLTFTLPLPNLNWLPSLFLSSLLSLSWTGLQACWYAGTQQQSLGVRAGLGAWKKLEREAIQMGARMRFRARLGDERRWIITMPQYRVIFHTKYIENVGVKCCIFTTTYSGHLLKPQLESGVGDAFLLFL